MTQQIAETVLGTKPDPDVQSPAGGPSNQEIVTKAKQAYGLFQATVDASALALTNTIKSGVLTPEITALDAVEWSGEVSESVVDPIFASRDVETAIAAATRPILTYSVSAFFNQLPHDAVGVAGFARSLTGRSSSELTLSLDIFKNVVSTDAGRNLQLGQWVKNPSELHDDIYGLYIQTTVQGITVDLKIVLDTALAPYGFVESTGATLELPVSASPFGGVTRTS